MKTPTWALVIGICLILFGGCSVIKSVKAIYLPDLLEMQQNMFNRISEIQTDTTSTTDTLATTPDPATPEDPNNKIFKNMSEGMQEMFSMSDFTKIWTVRFGYIGIFVAILYILSGVFLLIKRDFSILLVYIALITSLVFSVIQLLVLTSDSSGGLMSKSSGFNNIFGMVIDIILIIVVVTIDKSTYLKNTGRHSEVHL